MCPEIIFRGVGNEPTVLNITWHKNCIRVKWDSNIFILLLTMVTALLLLRPRQSNWFNAPFGECG